MKTIQLRCSGAGLLPIEQLKEFQGELKSLSEKAFNQLKNEILETGFAFPIHVWRNTAGVNFIIGGHQRHRVLLKLKEEGYAITEVPVVYIEADTVEEAKRRVLQDVAQYGQIEGQGLYQFLSDAAMPVEELLKDFKLPDINIDSFKIEFFDDNKVAPGGDIDSVSDASKETRTKPGDVWLLGEHRVMCGDATNMEHVERLLGGQKAEMCFTDPPYGVNEKTNRGEKGRGHLAESNNFSEIIGDDSIDTAQAAFSIAQQLSNVIVYWGANNYPFLPVSRGWIAWDKRENKGQDDNGDAELAWTNMDKPIRVFYHLWKGMIKASEHGEARVHPTQKPVALAEWCFENYGNPKTVLDLFGGSGSTLIACERTKRKCFMLEISPHYIDTIISRWERVTQKTAILSQ